MKRMTVGPSRMRGLSLTGWMLVIITVIVFGTFAAKTAPAYMDFATISKVIEGVLDDSKAGLQSENEIRASIAKRLSINGIRDIDPDAISIDKQDGKLKIVVDYEVRENFLSNIDIAMVFQREFERSFR